MPRTYKAKIAETDRLSYEVNRRVKKTKKRHGCRSKEEWVARQIVGYENKDGKWVEGDRNLLYKWMDKEYATKVKNELEHKYNPEQIQAIAGMLKRMLEIREKRQEQISHSSPPLPPGGNPGSRNVDTGASGPVDAEFTVEKDNVASHNPSGLEPDPGKSLKKQVPTQDLTKGENVA